jgi:ATP-dependent helicase/nuclease subunit A
MRILAEVANGKPEAAMTIDQTADMALYQSAAQAMTAAATADQTHAADPHASVFVSANAGTGKTKLLTDRVLRLLLSGSPADSILCVTYTRTAAAEMRNRIYRRLASWATMSADKLGAELTQMGLPLPSQEVRQRARTLFAEILDNDDGPRVETVHSFCQSILRRFPIEAGVPPHVALADDDEQARLKGMARHHILDKADPEMATAVITVGESASEDQANDILNRFIALAPRLDQADQLQHLEAHFRDRLAVPDMAASLATRAAAMARIDTDALRMAVAALTAYGSDDQVKRAAKLDVWLAQPDDEKVAKWDFLCAALFSGNKPRSRLSTKAVRDMLPAVDDIQQAVIDILLPLMAEATGQQCRVRTLALYRYGMAFAAEYKRLKTQRGLLDYQDLIDCTNHLLQDSDAAAWVAWKLDNGIQHLLIDEAQDTSPEQWRLLRHLADAFFDDAPNPDSNTPSRSVFAVGDFKQSIYSFQGADPVVMTTNRQQLGARATAVRADFRDVSLSVSFRSTRPILDLVNAVIPDLPGISDFTSHQLARAGDGGFVELLPVVGADDATAEWGTELVAARLLARRLKGWIGHRPLPSGKVMRAGDILILMRKRGRFFELLLGALQAEGIMVAGADRMKLAEQIEIQDLLALGDVMHLPDDDLQLAAVLKSPLFGMTEDELFTLAYDRGMATLFTRLMMHRGGDSRFGVMADKLARWQRRAEYDSVFGFFSYVLTDGGRQQFCHQLGSSVDESLDHFLDLAQKFALTGGASLVQFGAAIRQGGGEVKRDMDAAGHDEVRVMTIHGAKGLEAPVVILPDMLRGKSVTDPLAASADGQFYYWLPPAAGVQPGFIEDAKAAAATLRSEEDNRLLYVALTRARDGLVIGGWEKPHGVRKRDGSDYARLADMIAAWPGAKHLDDGHILIETPQSRRLDDDPDHGPDLPPVAVKDNTAPSWLREAAPVDDRRGKPLRPSQPGPDPAASPLADSDVAQHRQMALARGRLAHRLLEILPTTPHQGRRAAADRICTGFAEVPRAIAAALVKQVTDVIYSPDLAVLFGPDALVEVPINGRVNGYGVAGQIDRLYVDAKRIVLADFKTGTKKAGPPPLAYRQQMALYDALLQQIYPGRAIECWLVWIDTADYEVIDRAMRQDALGTIFFDNAAHDG